VYSLGNPLSRVVDVRKKVIHRSLDPDLSQKSCVVGINRRASVYKDSGKREQKKDASPLEGTYEIDTALNQCRPFPVFALRYKG
jgi:hypothetical protein